jgi:ferritin-like metal-binding protein YciE
VEEKTEDSAQASELQAAHQRHIADVQGPVEKAQQVLAYLNRVAGLRQRAHQLLHSYQSYDAIISWGRLVVS